jgi:hypothetical protein
MRWVRTHAAHASVSRAPGSNTIDSERGELAAHSTALGLTDSSSEIAWARLDQWQVCSSRARLFKPAQGCWAASRGCTTITTEAAPQVTQTATPRDHVPMLEARDVQERKHLQCCNITMEHGDSAALHHKFHRYITTALSIADEGLSLTPHRQLRTCIQPINRSARRPSCLPLCDCPSPPNQEPMHPGIHCSNQGL